MMPSEPATDPGPQEQTAARRTSTVLLWIAAAALVGNCLLTSPGRFSKQHRLDRSLLKPVVELLALDGAAPTLRGVEIRDLCFYAGAALLTLVGAVHFLSTNRRPRLTSEDLLDVRRRATGPYFWWGVLLLVSVLTSAFSHAPAVCKGQVIIRFLQLAWWWPLAALLFPRHVRSLSAVLLAAIAATAALGIWHYSVRVEPGWLDSLMHARRPQMRLQYPIGNELWFGACLLPAVFLAIGLMAGRGAAGPATAEGASPAGAKRGGRSPTWIAALLALAIVLVALLLTQSRSAGVGLAAGFVTLLFLLARGKTARLCVVFVGLVLAIGGVWSMQRLGESGPMGKRAHSIRARLNYEWPYALVLFSSKPIGGQGDGCYAMLAGQFDREKQLEDPSVIAVEQNWTVHAHNEPLELLADIGLAGTLAYLLALVTTLVFAVKFCDRLRETPDARERRWLAMALSAALVGMVIEECSDVALRQPGFPPIFLAIWAGLWALARGERRTPVPATVTVPASAPLGTGLFRFGGVTAFVAAFVLGYYGIQDWRADLARYRASQAVEAKDFAEAIGEADFAADRTLDPFQKLSARLLAAQARSAEFARRLTQATGPLSDEDLRLAQEGLARLNRLSRAAPRFVGLSQTAAQLLFHTANAYGRRGEMQIARDRFNEFLRWLEQNRADEPFNIDVVARLWQFKQDATTRDRLTWLRALLRRRWIDEPYLQLVQGLRQLPDTKLVLDDLMNIAADDYKRPPSKWADPLSPETVRLMALAYDWSDRPKDAADLVVRADEMYGRAGPRLFLAHAASVREWVEYSLEVDPTGRTEDLLRALVRARTILAGPVVADQANQMDKAIRVPLPDELGETRLKVLLAAGRESQGSEQLKLIAPQGSATLQQRLAQGYASLAGDFTANGLHPDLSLRMVKRAIELWADLPQASYVQAELYLQQDDEMQARVGLERFIKLMPTPSIAYPYLRDLERRSNRSEFWSSFRKAHPDFATWKPGPALPAAATPRPTSAPGSTSGPSPASRPAG
ncbi:MAG: O-antigen ligase family protein [Phycisphaerae bacterium]